MIQETLEAASQIEPRYAWRRVSVLAALAGLVPESQRGEVLDKAVAVAKAIGDDWERALAFAALAPWLPDPERSEVLAEALAAARQIEDPAVRAYKLREMVVELPEPLRSQVIAETLSLLLADPVALRAVPDSFLLHLPPHQRSELAARVLLASFDQEPHIWLPLVNPRKLVPHLLAEQSPTVFDGFARYLRARCQAGRPAILRRLNAPVIEYLGGAAAIEQTARAVADVGQWWP